MTTESKANTHALLKRIETGDSASVAVVNQDQYIQHNPQTHEGGEGLAALFKRLSKTYPRVNIVCIFSGGDFVFGHSDYDFSTSQMGIEVFSFEGDQTVEHWDKIQSRLGPNISGYSMVDGPAEVLDLEQTESNRTLIEKFVQTALIGEQIEQLQQFISKTYIEQSPLLSALYQALASGDADSELILRYEKLHRVLADSNLVLSVCKEHRKGINTSFYDLFRIEGSKIVEHWDTTEKVAPRSEWNNDNGKFLAADSYQVIQ